MRKFSLVHLIVSFIVVIRRVFWFLIIVVWLWSSLGFRNRREQLPPCWLLPPWPPCLEFCLTSLHLPFFQSCLVSGLHHIVLLLPLIVCHLPHLHGPTPCLPGGF